MYTNTPTLWHSAFPVPRPDGNKYDRGHVLVAGGGIASTGATKLAAHAALRVGAGLVSVACDGESLPVYAASFQAVMTKRADTVDDFARLLQDTRINSVVTGPGAGVTERTKNFVTQTLLAGKALVIDADALTVFAHDAAALFARIQSPCIVTPHAGEFGRLFAAQGRREDRVAEAARLSKAVVILKGFHTLIAAPDGRIAVNTNATPYLATAGTGDVLAGLCAGLLAQGMPAFEAACAAVWLHAEVARRFGAGLVAEDIANGLPAVLHALVGEYTSP